MPQLELFPRSELATWRDRTASRNYSPERDQFRREHERHREWGLRQRHGRRSMYLRLYGDIVAPADRAGGAQAPEPSPSEPSPPVSEPADAGRPPVAGPARNASRGRELARIPGGEVSQAGPVDETAPAETTAHPAAGPALSPVQAVPADQIGPADRDGSERPALQMGHGGSAGQRPQPRPATGRHRPPRENVGHPEPHNPPQASTRRVRSGPSTAIVTGRSAVHTATITECITPRLQKASNQSPEPESLKRRRQRPPSATGRASAPNSAHFIVPPIIVSGRPDERTHRLFVDWWHDRARPSLAKVTDGVAAAHRSVGAAQSAARGSSRPVRAAARPIRSTPAPWPRWPRAPTACTSQAVADGTTVALRLVGRPPRDQLGRVRTQRETRSSHEAAPHCRNRSRRAARRRGSPEPGPSCRAGADKRRPPRRPGLESRGGAPDREPVPPSVVDAAPLRTHVWMQPATR